MESDSIIQRLKREGFNTTADIIILKSLYDTQKANRFDLYQPLQSPVINQFINKRYKSPRNTWFGIGINPYVFISKHDTLTSISEFGELLHAKNKHKWSTTLTKARDLVPMLGPILQKKKRRDAVEWYSNFMENESPVKVTYDKNRIPKMHTEVLLTDYVTYSIMSNRNDSSDFHLKMVYSNQKSKGVFFNMVTAGIVRQARNYENAKLLMEYMASDKMNEKLNNRWYTYPISLHDFTHPFAYQNAPFRIFKGSSSKIMVNYPLLDLIVRKKRTVISSNQR